MQLVVAGKSHPADDGGKALIQEIVRFADDPAVRHRIVFLPDYDMSMARYLYWGCDVWLNNPLRPLEACGTSGMKSALNGGLNLSIRDGWWDELYDGRNGWAIPTADGIDDPHRRDDLEANALYELLGTQVAPAFYERTERRAAAVGGAGAPHARRRCGPQVQATRMVREYAEGLYAPAASAAAAVAADGYAGAKEIAEFRARLSAAWTRVEVLGVDASGLPDTPVVGAPMTVRAAVRLAGLDPSDVAVQAVVGQVDETDDMRNARAVPMEHVGEADAPGEERFEAVVPLPFAGLTGYTVRVLPNHPLLASPAELGKVVLRLAARARKSPLIATISAHSRGSVAVVAVRRPEDGAVAVVEHDVAVVLDRQVGVLARGVAGPRGPPSVLVEHQVAVGLHVEAGAGGVVDAQVPLGAVPVADRDVAVGQDAEGELGRWRT